jgi:glycosyltransferase involved in cell wall biosynthesis
LKILLFANTDWYLYNFRYSLADHLRSLGHVVLLVSPPGEYASRLEESGFHWIPFPMDRRGANPIKELITLWRLFRLYRRQKPDIVHHFTVKCVLYGSLAAKLNGIPRIVNAITGLGYLFLGRGIKAWMMRTAALILYRPALRKTEIIFQNQDDLEVFRSFGLASKNQAHLIPGSGIDTIRLQVMDESEGTPVVVLAARMLWDKGVGEFVNAARILKEEGVAGRFVLCGTGYEDNPASIPAEQLERWEREGSVEWWRWQEDMYEVYQLSHIACLPSYREGLPRSLAEAAACGRALVAADTPGCRLVVRHGYNGLLVPARDAAALARALKELMLDPKKRREMGINGRRLVEENFSQERVLADTLGVYRRLGMMD